MGAMGKFVTMYYFGLLKVVYNFLELFHPSCESGLLKSLYVRTSKKSYFLHCTLFSSLVHTSVSGTTT